MNAILICSKCKEEFDKGCPAQAGQDDANFVCEECQFEIDKQGLMALAPTIEVFGGK